MMIVLLFPASVAPLISTASPTLNGNAVPVVFILHPAASSPAYCPSAKEAVPVHSASRLPDSPVMRFRYFLSGRMIMYAPMHANFFGVSVTVPQTVSVSSASFTSFLRLVPST